MTTLVMDNWHAVQKAVCDSFCAFLSRTLPDLCAERWWVVSVLNNLTIAQLRSVQGISEGDLAALDLAALLRVADKNWMEIAVHQPALRDARSLLNELRSIRNCYAHSTTKGVSPEDQLRHLDTIRRILRAIGSDPKSLELVDRLHRVVLLQVAESLNPREIAGGTPLSGGHSNGSGVPEFAGDSASPPATPPVEAESPNDGGGWLIESEKHQSELERETKKRTFVGIDFGTSTSVASVIRMVGRGATISDTLAIRQPDEFGGTIDYHLVNTVLAWKNGRLLFGRDAYRLRQELFEGRNVFSSFKMRLGIDIGPTYPETALRRGGDGPVPIESATDATREFFRLLADGIREAVAATPMPGELCFAVTVPASFEANQRRDLLECMAEAGLPVAESGLIDEPNAAFLSFLHERSRNAPTDELLKKLYAEGSRVLVYDFGAGTCDVSVLEVKVSGGQLKSRNRAISRFTALGGDDIDRAIARDVLLPQLLAASPGFDPEIRDIEERIVPRLQPTAERLKVAAVDWFTDRRLSSLAELRRADCEPFINHAVPAFKIRDRELSLQRPSMTLRQFADALEPLVGKFDPESSSPHVHAPVADAIEKSGLQAEQLDAVLFIGGSAANPIVRSAVMAHLPSNVRPIVPVDLRTHVSLGAALHCLGFHAFGHDLIRPITSEPIFIIAKGGRLERIVPAGSEVPTEQRFETRLRVERDGQQVVELPVCVSSESKLLGLLRIESSRAGGFRMGEEVLISAGITRDKLLDIEARVGDAKTTAALLNPLSNGELTQAETRMLEAKQRFNAALLKNRGRPPKEVILEYAEAAAGAEAWEVAADMYVALERIDSTEDRATSICYAYSRAGRHAKSSEWGKRAHERHPTAITAYNLSCDAEGNERERLLREALKMNPGLACALLALGKILKSRGQEDGQSMLESCLAKYQQKLDRHEISEQECHNLIDVAKLLKKDVVVDRAKARLEVLGKDVDRPYDEQNLAGSLSPVAFLTEG